MKSNIAAGSARKPIWRYAEENFCANSEVFPSENDFENDANAAVAYDTPIIPTGTANRLLERLKTEIDPTAKVEPMIVGAIKFI